MMRPVLPEAEPERAVWRWRFLSARNLARVFAGLALIALACLAWSVYGLAANRPLTGRLDQEQQVAEDSPAYAEWRRRHEDLLGRQKALEALPLSTPAEELAQARADFTRLRGEFQAFDRQVLGRYFFHLGGILAASWLLVGSLVGLVLVLRVQRAHDPSPPSPIKGHDPAAVQARELLGGRGGVAMLLVALLAIGVALVWTDRGPPPRLIEPVPDPGPALVVSEIPAQPPTPAEYAGQWHCFRGPAAGAAERAVHRRWDAPAWKVVLPLAGYSSPAVWRERVFVSAADQNQRLLLGFAVDSGKELWRHEVKGLAGSPAQAPKVYGNEAAMYAVPSPVTDGRLAFAIYANGDLVACDCRSGRRVWGRNLGAPDDTYGFAQSPLLFQDLLIVPYEHNGASAGIYGLDARTGTERWKSPMLNEGCHWVSPILAPGPKGVQLIIGGPTVFGLDPVTGKEIWHGAKGLSGDVSPSPACGGGLVAVMMERCSALAFPLDGSGNVQPKWTATGDFPDMASPVSDGERLWALSKEGLLSCLRMATKELIYKDQEVGAALASPLLVAGGLLVVTSDGQAVFVERGDSFKIQSKADLGESVHATPAILDDGAWIVRGTQHLLRIGKPGETPAAAPTAAVKDDLPPPPEPVKPVSPPASPAAGATHAWPMFRGAGSDATASADLPDTWDMASRAGILWSVPSEFDSYSSPVILDGRVFVSGADAQTRVLAAFDLATGTVLWRHPVADIPGTPADIGKVYDPRIYAAPTPAAAAGLVAALFANGDLVVCKSDSGDRVWAKNLGLAKQPKGREYGAAQSPLIWRDLLIVSYEHDGEGAGIHAFALATGEERWASPGLNPGKAHWVTPVLARVGERELLVVGGYRCGALDPERGAVVWTSALAISGDVTPSPAIGGGLAFLMMRNAPLRAYALDANGEAKPAWEVKARKVTDVPSPISDGRRLWCVTTRGECCCWDAITGTSMYESNRFTKSARVIVYASPLLISGRILAVGNDGVSFWLGTGDTFAVLGEASLGEEIYATPAVADGRLVLRGTKRLICVGKGK